MQWDHYGYGMGTGYGWGMGFGWLYMIVFLILIILCIIFLVKLIASPMKRERKEEAPLQILKKRYARGEITPEEYERIKKDIE